MTFNLTWTDHTSSRGRSHSDSFAADFGAPSGQRLVTLHSAFSKAKGGYKTILPWALLKNIPAFSCCRDIKTTRFRQLNVWKGQLKKPFTRLLGVSASSHLGWSVSHRLKNLLLNYNGTYKLLFSVCRLRDYIIVTVTSCYFHPNSWRFPV